MEKYDITIAYYISSIQILYTNELKHLELSIWIALLFCPKSKEEMKVAANVESMFSVRVTPWHGLGTIVEDAPASADALRLAGLDWRVEQTDVYTRCFERIPGYKANIRSTDQKVLGVVTDRYQIVQNEDAFAFTDKLLGEGVTYETAGSIQDGRKVWMLARLPKKYMIDGDEIDPYFVIMNSHDGSCAIKAAMTPIRVVCQNTLNLALNQARRSWTTKHTAKIMDRMKEAEQTLFFAQTYMDELGKGIHKLNQIQLSDKKVMEYMSEFFPTTPDLSDGQVRNNLKLLNDMKRRYFDAPDLKHVGKNGYRFLNAVSDFATHAEPIRKTKNYQENLFVKTVEGNLLIDKAYRMVMASA